MNQFYIRQASNFRVWLVINFRAPSLRFFSGARVGEDEPRYL
jgi:hypothetical protein